MADRHPPGHRTGADCAPGSIGVSGAGTEPARLGTTDRTGLRDASSPAGPERTCVGCRVTDSRSVLLRVVAGTDEGGGPAVIPDPRCRLFGRGAWLHPRIDCLDLAVRRRAFPRALRCNAGSVEPVRAYLEALAQQRCP
ncbi:YlxR family protein [Janibacter sp. GXQ6167]|uniref:YlxR family protein n=1 Tax=Janibacter sp. GXQ6167 TaxID=3240791 RepID=UPI003525A78A